MIIKGIRNNGFARPSDDINPNLKRNSKSWYLDYGGYIWNFGNKSGLTPYSLRHSYSIYRSYAEAKQDPNQYKVKFPVDSVSTDTDVSSVSEYNSGNTKKGKRKGILNISWEIVSVMPKYINILLGKFGTMDHVIGATAIDKLSGDEREDKKYSLFARKMLDPLFRGVYKTRGVTYIPPGYLPDNAKEAELFASMGGSKLQQEQAMELMIQHSFDISNWDKIIKDKVFKDFITIGISGVTDKFNTNSNKVEQEWMDMANVIIPFSYIDNPKNIPWWGRIKLYTIAELRQKGFAEDKLAAMVQKNIDINGGIINTSSRGDYNNDNDNVNIQVLEMEIRSTDTFYDVKHTNKFGKIRMYEEKEYGKIRNTDTKKTKVTRVNNVYQCKWIIGTEDIFEYGLKNGQPRVGKDVEMSCHVVKLAVPSMVAMAKTHLDELQFDFLLLQNAKASARPNGIAINLDSISNMKMGGKSMHPLDIMEIYRSTGDLLFKVTPMGLSGLGNNLGKPMEELRGGIGQLAVDIMNDIQFRLKMIQEVTGINEIAAAGNPNPNQSVGGSELALMATDNALRPLYKGYITIKERTAKNTCLRVQLALLANQDSYEAYYPVLGKFNLAVLTIGQKAMEASFNIRIEAIPTEQEKKDLKAYISQAMIRGENGMSVLSPSNVLLLNEMLSSNIPLKGIRVMIGFFENKEREIQALKEKENYTLQAQLKQQSDENASKLAMQVKQFDTNELLRLEKGKAIIKTTIEMNKEGELETNIKTLEHHFKMLEDANKIELEDAYGKDNNGSQIIQK
jgi:hypothetical protein